MLQTKRFIMRIQRIYLGQVAMANVLSHATVRLAAASTAPLTRVTTAKDALRRLRRIALPSQH
jgi:hypothetical protein